MSSRRRSVSQQPSVKYEEEQWEAHKEQFRRYYIEQDMSLDAATAQMRAHHDFHANPRQWERKIKTWHWAKYESQESRQSFVENCGKSLEEILNSGICPEGDDQRKFRRWVHRQLGRSPSRSRPHGRSDPPPSSVLLRPPGQDDAVQHGWQDATYDVGLRDDPFQDQGALAPPDTIMLEATLAETSSDSPVQLVVHRDRDPQLGGHVRAPDISLSVYNDIVARLEPSELAYADLGVGSNDQATFQNAMGDFPMDTSQFPNMAPPNEYEQYLQSQPSMPYDPGTSVQPLPYPDAALDQWTNSQHSNGATQTQPDGMHPQAAMTSSFPDFQDMSNMSLNTNLTSLPDYPSNAAPSFAEGRDISNSPSGTTAPFSAELLKMIDEYTHDVYGDLQRFLPQFSIPGFKEKLESDFRYKRNLFFNTISVTIENRDRALQRTHDSTLDKCRALQKIMVEKGIDVRRELVLARQQRPMPTYQQPVSPIDPQFYDAFSVFDLNMAAS